MCHIKVIPVANETMRRQDIDLGHPDLLLLTRRGVVTYYFHLELKTKTGSLGDNQIAWNESFDKDFKSANASRAVAYGFAQCKEIIQNWIESIAPQGHLTE